MHKQQALANFFRSVFVELYARDFECNQLEPEKISEIIRQQVLNAYFKN